LRLDLAVGVERVGEAVVPKPVDADQFGLPVDALVAEAREKI
jgi:hypothetical protein